MRQTKMTPTLKHRGLFLYKEVTTRYEQNPTASTKTVKLFSK